MPSPLNTCRTLTALLALLPSCARPSALQELTEEQTCRRTRTVGFAAETERSDSAASGGVDARPQEALPAGGEDRVASDPAAVGAPSPTAVRPARLQVDWRLPGEVEQVHRLNAWCAAVGPAVVGGWAEGPRIPVADTLVVVSWNVHVGGGHLRELVDDLRAGRLTGGDPVDHFVLLLQEAYRAGEAIPGFEPGLPGGSDVAAAPAGREREDVVQDAEALGLSLLYVPAMRSGRQEDRGNAILSTLPMTEPVAVELPVARQRRVAAAAVIGGRTSEGRPWRIQVASVHLENQAEGWIRDEHARLIQGQALLDGLPEAESAIAAGDFNTWQRDRSEAVIRAMERAYPQTPPFPRGPTYRRAWGLVRRYLDYIFFRLPDDASARYHRVPRLYNSDHYPLVGAVVLGTGDR
jgi:endonuclease/exonuclease/phosphatase family metal-dependent hydrolase